MAELVSVLIPAYNAERWLKGAIRSAVAQTWPHVEVIVVDDGSTDGTLAIAKSLEGKTVKVVTQTNQGAAAARNRALQLAQGSYIQWLDADDLLDSNKVATQMRAAAADRRVLLSGGFGTFYYRIEKAKFVETSLWRNLTPLDYFLVRFRNNVCFQTGAWLVSRELTDAAGPWTDFESPDDDGEYFCRVVANSREIIFVRDARIYYRVGNFGSLANRRSQKAVAALFRSKAKSIGHLLALENSPRTRAASFRLLQDWEFHECEYPEIAAASHQLAAELGGTLTRPEMALKYKPIELLFGYGAAFSSRRVLSTLRPQLECTIDRLLYKLSTAAPDEYEFSEPARGITPGGTRT
jgi:glycosyltransferase involved in cell wall biosynthesis